MLQFEPFSTRWNSLFLLGCLSLGLLACQQAAHEKHASAPEKPSKRLIPPDFSNETQYYTKSTKALTPDHQGKVWLFNFDLDSLVQVSVDSVRDLNTYVEESEDRFPEAVFQYKNLRMLWIGMRGFKTIPPGIGQLKALEEIDFQHGSIEKLPDDFCQLKNLRHAIFLFSDLKELPECIGDMENLEFLHLGYTQITRFPESIRNLKQLKLIQIQQSPDGPHLSEEAYQEVKAMMPWCGIGFELRNPD